MIYMLDTNTCIALIKGNPAAHKKLLGKKPGEVSLSALTLAEMRYGADNSNRPDENHKALDEFILPLEIFNFDDDAARQYGIVRSALRKAGLPIGPIDTLIAGHALSLDAILVTNNTEEFRRVRGLKLEDWTLV